jgi:hypothetical protein
MKKCVKLIIIKNLCVSIFLTLLSETFLIKEKTAKYDETFILIFMQSTLYSCPILIKFEYFVQIFETYLHIYENVPSESLVACGRTEGRADGHRYGEVSSLFSQVCEHA